jgi:hypothetical protein
VSYYCLHVTFRLCLFIVFFIVVYFISAGIPIALACRLLPGQRGNANYYTGRLLHGFLLPRFLFPIRFHVERQLSNSILTAPLTTVRPLDQSTDTQSTSSSTAATPHATIKPIPSPATSLPVRVHLSSSLSHTN